MCVEGVESPKPGRNRVFDGVSVFGTGKGGRGPDGEMRVQVDDAEFLAKLAPL